MAERILIVGGVAAGTSVAAKAKRTNPELEIVLYQREQFIAYSACGLPYYIADYVSDHNKLIARTPLEFAKQGIDINLGHEVLDIDSQAGRIMIRDHASNSTKHDHYDHLVLATGARVFCPPIEGIDLEGVFQLRSMADGLAIKAFIKQAKPRSAVVVGAGYIGIEMAETLLNLGISVTVMDMDSQVLRTLDPEMAAIVEQTMQEAGVQLRLASKLGSLNSKPNGRVCCSNTEGTTIDSDIVILATGVQPNNQLAQTVGLACGPRDAIQIDGLGRTSVERIYGAGDCCTVFNQVLGIQSYLPLGTTANKQGRTLGAYLGGIERPFAGVVGSAATKFNDLHIGSTGISEQAAKLLGYDIASAMIESTDHAGYYPNAKPMWVKLIADKKTGTLLGGQVVGYDDVAKRVDTIALALQQAMSVDDFAWSDLTYAPPFSSVWDPILVAAQKLTNTLRKE